MKLLMFLFATNNDLASLIFFGALFQTLGQSPKKEFFASLASLPVSNMSSFDSLVEYEFPAPTVNWSGSLNPLESIPRV